MTMKKTLIASAVMASIFIAPAAFAFKEYPAGEPVTMNEMELAAVYLQPIDMEPRGMGLPAAKADVHLEADIHAVEGNKNGTVAKLAMRQPFVLFKGLTFQKLCLPGAFRPGDHH
uniref:iron transporter n=1 Tax=Escherichia coli TaxID=562 RepID=UPI0020401191